MTVYTLQAPLPQLFLQSGMRLRIEAINPTTGAAVSGVTCSHWAIYGNDESTTAGGNLTSGPFMLVPGSA